ncbi:high-affinity Zn(2+) transporter zrt1 [Mortierella polycephala]|uniref:High-affinity Zn(2+) transporter zrt1 n=1 Tax=Mortierella polycephala TaxID=41804 RepID=A0A9P6Q220_9FUNG|nr:high-affinity Zn(2+) transporter zrt1 [Mortierella polycephala]
MSLQESLEDISNQTPGYSLGLHIAGVLIILAASTLGVFMPLIAARIPAPSRRTHPLRINMRIPSLTLTLGKQFGTGIILATAFIHTLPTAMSNLSSPRLGPTFSEHYQAFGGLITLGSSLFMHWIDFMATEHNQKRVQEAAAESGIPTGKGQDVKMDLGGLGATGIATAPCPDHTVTIVEGVICRRSSCSSASSCSLDHDASGEQAPLVLSKSQISYASTDNAVLARANEDSPVLESLMVTRQQSSSPSDSTDRHHHHLQEIRHSHGLELLNDTQRRISTYILEAGVAAHSVIIGVTLGVSSDAEFTGLLIALVFHQFFEGFALGARIADLDFERAMAHYLLASIFSLTTPVGTVLGIAIANSYSEDSAVALLTEGILDAVSTGILLYMGYVNLLAVEFNLNGEIREENARVKSLCFMALWTGAGIMAFIGIFA